MISLNQVSVSYRGSRSNALNGVSLVIERGEFVFLIGSSGSGKSSILRLLLREQTADSGEVFALGENINAIRGRKVANYRRKLGVVFQDFRLLPNKNVYENVAFALEVIGKPRAFIETSVPDVLRLVGLEEKLKSYPNELSGGEQQRVAIARAIVNKPQLLLADEPTGNLDRTNSDDIMGVLERIHLAGTTVLMATHDEGIVERMGRRVVEISQGSIVRDQSSEPTKRTEGNQVGDWKLS